jgi:dipeptidyl-peptidase-4
MDELQSMKTHNQYTVLNADRATRSMQIDLYDFATLNKVSTLIDSKNFLILATASMLIRSRRMKKILIANNSNPIFRHSFTADYFLYDIQTTHQIVRAGAGAYAIARCKEIALPRTMICLCTTSRPKNHSSTTDGKKNSIINGITDWVYEEEFAFVRAFDWAPTAKK